MKYGKTKKFILVILGMFALVFVVAYFFQKTKKPESQNLKETIMTGTEIPVQGIVKNLGDLEITIFQADEAEYYDTGDQEDKKYYRVFLKISNWNQKEKQIISEIVLTDNLGNFYQQDNLITSIADLKKLGKWVFYPMVTVDGYIVFPVINEKAAKMELVIKDESGQVKFEFRK